MAHDINTGYDNLSLLPDCILHQILSFIPTKEAVATCILSKRWKYLWTFVPSVNFDDSILYNQPDHPNPLDVNRFKNFVDKVLLLRDTAIMNRFRLYCRVCFTESRVNEWISAAMKHNVQELDICFFAEQPFMLPICVFDNTKLTDVKLELNCILELPTHISFPCLRKLHLCQLTFPDDNLMQGLLSGCPLLEELAVLDCDWPNLKTIMINMPLLKNLIIDDPSFYSARDLEGCVVKIDAGNLVFFKYICYLSNDIDVLDFSSSAIVSVQIHIANGRQLEVAYRTIKLLRGLQNVSKLRISSTTITSLFIAQNLMDQRLPVLKKLSLLELSGEFGEQSIISTIKFLQSMPNLEYLHFDEGIGHCEDDSKLKLVNNCILSSPKIVNYKNFLGTATEIWFLEFLLKNAVVLEKMNVSWSKSSAKDPMNQKEIEDQLRNLHKGFSHCELLFT